MSDERDKQVSTYVSEETKEQLKREADRADEPLSKYIRGLIQQARLEDTQEQLARDLNAEERLLEIIKEGKAEMAEMTEQVERQNQTIQNFMAHLGGYSIANWKLLKATHQPSEAQASEWFASAGETLSETGSSVDPAVVGNGMVNGNRAGAADKSEPRDGSQDEKSGAKSFADKIR